MKRFLTTVIAIVLVYAMCFASFAVSAQYTYEFENITVIFDTNTVLDEHERMIVAEHLAHGEETVTTYGLWCTLFGHSYEEHSATKITHCVRTTNPRCLEEEYLVQVCTRCENTVTESLGGVYITCCPEE